MSAGPPAALLLSPHPDDELLGCPAHLFALRDAVKKGWVEGPRILAAGAALTPEGGHADVHGWRPEVMLRRNSPG